MENTIIALGLFSLGLYIILNINNDVNTKCVKNSGYLELDNNVDINNNQVINDNKNSFTNTNSLNILNDQLNKNNNLNVQDLLPKNVDNGWNWDVPTQNITLEESNLLSSATKKIGSNTQGNSLKNPSYDIRGNIPNPKFQISPFNNSSYDPDTNIKSFC